MIHFYKTRINRKTYAVDTLVTAQAQKVEDTDGESEMYSRRRRNNFKQTSSNFEWNSKENWFLQSYVVRLFSGESPTDYKTCKSNCSFITFQKQLWRAELSLEKT